MSLVRPWSIKGDALYGIRSTCRSAPNTSARTDVPTGREAQSLGTEPRSHLAWQGYEKLRNISHARPEHGRALVTDVIASFPTCPIPEVARLGRTLEQCESAILAYFDTKGAVPPKDPPKRSSSSKRPGEPPAASVTSPTTGSDAYSLPAGNAPTRRKKPTMPKCEGPHS